MYSENATWEHIVSLESGRLFTQDSEKDFWCLAWEERQLPVVPGGHASPNFTIEAVRVRARVRISSAALCYYAFSALHHSQLPTLAMPPRAPASESSTKPRKTRSRGGGGKKKLTPFNKFMQSEMARLKEDEPDISHQDRFKMATSNWKDSKLNPNNAT